MRVIQGAGSFLATSRPFYVYLDPQHTVYQPGDTVQIDIKAKDANGKAVAFEGVARMHRLRREYNEKKEAYAYALGAVVAERIVSVDEHGGMFRAVADEAGTVPRGCPGRRAGRARATQADGNL